MAKSVPNPPSKIPPWTERNELNLLNAVLEIANEPTESYDPRVNLFDRINMNMEKSLTDREILEKIKDLRNRFEKRCWKREYGNKAVKTTKAFAISEKIWGKGIDMKIGRERREKNAKSLKVKPQEASRPNPKQGHEPTKKRNSAEPKYKCQPDGKKQKFTGSFFVCGNIGHIARDCSRQKIAKQSTKQQESTNTSESSVDLRIETENKHKELSSGSGHASSQPGSLQLTSEQTKLRDEVRDCSQPVAQDYISSQSIAYQPPSQQGMKFNDLQCGDDQYTSKQTKQRDEVRDSSIAQDHISSQSVTHQPTSEQLVKFNNLQCGDDQHTSEQRIKVPSSFKSGTYQHTSNQKKPFNRFRQILPRPPKWGPLHPIAMPLSFTLHPVPFQYPAPLSAPYQLLMNPLWRRQ